MPDFIFPTSAEISQIAQDKLPRLTKDRPAFKFFPMNTRRAAKIVFEQRDNYRGLQQVRGIDGAPTRVRRIGAKTYEMQPGVYGEFVLLDEEEITLRRSYGTWGQPIDIKDLVMEAEEQLTQRFLDRVEVNIWTIITTGTFSVYHPITNALLHTDTFNVQSYTAPVAWSTYATATPLANFRAIKLLARGHSVTFDAQSEVYMNQVTFNNLVQNTNQSDLAGRRVSGLLSPLNLEEINKILLGEGLPQIVIYDEGYINDAGTFTLFIPDNTFTLIGKRPAGQTVGEYLMTINANNANAAPGRYMRVIDKGETEVPRRIEVHDGHNGGPAVYFPSAIVNGHV